MGIEHNGDHLADVCKTLGVRVEPGKLHLGMEIELGWESRSRRGQFFSSLTKQGLDKSIISKHDGSIRADVNSEIVTAPFEPKRFYTLVSELGRTIEEFSTRGMFTRDCGVHIHVSRDVLGRDQVWRYQQAIASNHGEWPSVHEFLDALTLRAPSEYCIREPHRTMMTFLEYRRHDRAVIFGAHSPTLETRIFRTPKSRRVLLSYVDFVLSLLEFCENAPREHLAPDKLPADWEALGWPHKKIAPALSVRTVEKYVDLPDGSLGTRREKRYLGVNGEILDPSQVQEVDYRGMKAVYPCQEILDREGWALPPVSSHVGAIGWKNNSLPLEAYIKYVLEHANRFPALAKRLELKRFTAFYATESLEALSPDAEHLEYRTGCLVAAEGYDGKFVIKSKIPESYAGLTPVTLQMADSDDPRTQYPFTSCVQYLSHVCPGAIDKGGEA